jgi:hypothetical protein
VLTLVASAGPAGRPAPRPVCDVPMIFPAAPEGRANLTGLLANK